MSTADPWSGNGRRIYIQEVGLRDGLQAETVFVPTDEKVHLVDALSETGVAKIEVTAFVSPKVIPALRDAEEMLRRIRRVQGVVYSALAPNVRGVERAIESKVDEVNLVMSASESHNLSNLGMTRGQSFSGLSEAAKVAHYGGVRVNVSLSCSFGCPTEGNVLLEQVIADCGRYFDEMGAAGITLCDTTGMAYPTQVDQLVKAFGARWPQAKLTLHFHNTRGLGALNVLAGIVAGCERFDTSVGGIGGCPYAPGATGNVCTEEVVHGLELMEYDTGVDLSKLITCAGALRQLLGHDIPSQILKAGGRLDLHARLLNSTDL